jgi:hypothetical protein
MAVSDIQALPNTFTLGQRKRAENLRGRILAQHARGIVPSAIAMTQNVTFGTVRTVLREAGIKIPAYLAWPDSAFGEKPERCRRCGHEL